MNGYPSGIYSHREMENLPGTTYDPSAKKTLFAEDINNLSAEIAAIESTLGVNPQGTYETVAERIGDMGGGAVENSGYWQFISSQDIGEGTTSLITDLPSGYSRYIAYYALSFSSNKTWHYALNDTTVTGDYRLKTQRMVGTATSFNLYNSVSKTIADPFVNQKDVASSRVELTTIPGTGKVAFLTTTEAETLTMRTSGVWLNGNNEANDRLRFYVDSPGGSLTAGQVVLLGGA